MKNIELKTTDRAVRILIGSGLILFTMLSSVTPLGLFALLPLVATYPIFAGLYGYDPVTQWTGKELHAAVRHTEHLLKSGHSPKHG